jgi:hypothetical protein
MVTLQSTVKVPDNVLFRRLDDEAVILNLDTAEYYGLDEVGTHMWHLFAEHGRLRTVYDLMLKEYDVSPSELQHDMLDFVGELVQHQLLELDDVPEDAG